MKHIKKFETYSLNEEKKLLHNVRNAASDMSTYFTKGDTHYTRWSKKVEEIARGLISKGYNISNKGGEWTDGHDAWVIFGDQNGEYKGHFMFKKEHFGMTGAERYSENVKVWYINEYSDLINVFTGKIDMPNIVDKIDEVIQRFVSKRSLYEN